jgi:hypothetical protein
MSVELADRLLKLGLLNARACGLVDRAHRVQRARGLRVRLRLRVCLL